MIYSIAIVVLGTLGLGIAGQFFGQMRVWLSALGLAIVLALTTDLAIIHQAKNARIGLTVVVFLIAVNLAWQARPDFNAMILATLAFLFTFFISSFWAEYPESAMLYKGLFSMMALAGLLWGWSLNNSDDLLLALRTYFLVFFVQLVMLWGMQVLDGGLGAVIGRMGPMGFNPNGVGDVAVLAVTPAVALLLYEEFRWKLIAQAALVLGAVALLLSGSRAAVGSAVIMSLIILGTRSKQVLLPVISGTVGIFIFFWLFPRFTQQHSVERLGNLDLLGRMEFWKAGMVGFYEAPLFGIGWNSSMLFGRMSTKNLHSIYVTILSEVGIVGSLVFLAMTGMIALTAFRVFFGKASHTTSNLVAHRFMLAAIAFFYAKGVFESGPLTGSSLFPFVAFFGIGALSSRALRFTPTR
ncbi:MAG: O-antigen ligase family protein [Planctomycetota bacterium]